MSNGADIHGMARAAVKYVAAPSDDVSGASKKRENSEQSYPDTQWEKSEGEEGVDGTRKSKRRRVTSTKMLEALENGSAVIGGLASARESRKNINKKDANVRSKQWRWVTIDGERKRFIGLECKVYWPLDDDWYYGRILGYNPLTDRFHVKYNDGDEEHLFLSNERISFYVSTEEMQQLNLCCVQHPDADRRDTDDMVALAASLDHCSRVDPIPGDMIWAKVSGHPMWPAIVLDESACGNLKILNKISGEQSVLVQFFGTHDFAMLSKKQVISFMKGLLSELHLKCKKSDFLKSLMEAKTYLNTEKLPGKMLSLQSGNAANFESAGGEEVGTKDEEISKNVNLRNCPLTWKDLDKCNVCYKDEEYDNNPFLQCDNCRMMVHTRCYGELEPADGTLWYCSLCRVGAPESPPTCCLCPLTGGAMKPTTDGRWAHLACAICIPETCLLDVRKMEPIDGLNRIDKNRWKLLCSICRVSHGACIQCSNSSCYVAYHPLCARAAGFFLEFANEDGLRLNSEEDENNQCIRLFSYCKRHKRPSDQCIVVQDRIGACQQSDYIPSPNPSGCARTEPYNYLGRVGRKQPQSYEVVSLKRLYLENIPYLVGGIRQHESLSKVVSSQCNNPSNISSMVEKYSRMKKTFRKRLAFGKSGIHGYGIFAKLPHRAGDMVIEYTGEVVRTSIADRREHLTYNSLVGAGTYMFQIDDHRIIDATKAGNIAHLMNHSCEPNCYSRIITVNGDEHVIIFAKRDIEQLEELTYNYRFSSVDEQLACYCGASRCRGVVNDIKAVEQVAKLCVPCSKLTAENKNKCKSTS